MNTLDEGETLAVLRGDDVLIPVASLEQAGVHGFHGSRERIKNTPYVSLRSLAPGIAYKLNEDALALDVTVSPSLLPSVTLNLDAARPAHVEYTNDRTTYMNYSLSQAGAGASNAFLEFASNAGDDTLYTSVNAASGQPVRRGLSYFEIDDRLRSFRAAVGDVLASSGDLGGSIFLGGIASARAFDLDPYAIHFPLPNIAGAVTTPSTADVYVNGVLVRRIDLPPGTFDLTHLPVTSGSVNTQVVVTDAFGHAQTYAQNYYLSTQLLQPGTTDFQYAAGLERRNAFGPGDGYGPAVALARYRIGVTGNVTAGGRFEASRQLVSFGPSLDARVPFGFVHVAGAMSRDAAVTGAAASVQYTFSSPRGGFGIAYFGQTAGYANSSQSAQADRALSAVSAFAALPLGRVTSLAVQFSRRAMRDSGTLSQLALSTTAPLGRDLSLSLTAERDTGTLSKASNSLLASLNVALGRSDASVGVRSGSDGTHETVQVQRSPQGMYGLRYVASMDSGAGSAVNGLLEERTRYGDYDLQYSDSASDGFGEQARASGGVVLAGGRVYATRPVTGSFALVEVPGLAGVHVYVENEDAGATDANGRLIVPDLIPNYGNVLRIEDSAAPLNASIQTVQKMVAPPARGGAVVLFPVERLQALSGKLIVVDGKRTLIPAYGDLTIHGKTFDAESGIGTNGEFYLENVPAGSYEARILYANGECEFTLNAPGANAMLVHLGTVRCVKS